MKMKYMLLLGLLINAAFSQLSSLERSPFIISGAILFTGYCIISVLEKDNQ
jgi:hypothetical protein